MSRGIGIHIVLQRKRFAFEQLLLFDKCMVVYEELDVLGVFKNY